jgi:hypothetical protein
VRKLCDDLRERLALESLAIDGGMTIFNHDRFRRCSLWEQRVLAKHSILSGPNSPLFRTRKRKIVRAILILSTSGLLLLN